MKRTHLIPTCIVLALLTVGALAYHQHLTRPQIQDAAAALARPEDLIALPIELPRPQDGGTPANLANVPNLEKSSDKPRPPFLAPRGVTNVALHKSVTSSVPEPMLGELAWIVDGHKEATEGSQVELDPFKQSVTIDLEAPHTIYAILFWHYHRQARIYFDVVVQVADDPDFVTNVCTLFNNDDDNSSGLGLGTDQHYIETHKGKLIDAKGVSARYVRLYSRGNTANDQNHYLEVEVYGRPVID